MIHWPNKLNSETWRAFEDLYKEGKGVDQSYQKAIDYFQQGADMNHPSSIYNLAVLYDFEAGEDQREAGERLAASYINFYLANHCVLLPRFDDENDTVAAEILGKCFPDRRILPVDARVILTGGGNIHCITQQIPAKKRGNRL